MGTKVENFGDTLAGGVVANAGGESICSAIMRFPSAQLQGSSFSAKIPLAGGTVIFAGTFTGATTAHGTWEETGPCYTHVIEWTATAGGTAPTGVNPGTGQQLAPKNGRCSPAPCGNALGLIAYVGKVDRNASGPGGARELYMQVTLVNTSTLVEPEEAIDFELKFASGKLSGWSTGDKPVKLSNGSTVDCSWWVSPKLHKGGRYGPANLCFKGSSASDLDGSLSVQFQDNWANSYTVYFPLR